MTTSATYRVQHSTVYEYEQPVKVCHNIVMLSPREDGPVINSSYRVHVQPQPKEIRRRLDYFGNVVETFSLSEKQHKTLQVTGSGRITVAYPSAQESNTSHRWEAVRDSVIVQEDSRWFEATQYQYDSPRITRSSVFKDYASESFKTGRPIVEAGKDLMQRIFADFEYDGEATDVHTPTDDAFEMRKGVCQDFAHVQIACLRSLAIPARYVSGYLRTVSSPDQQKLVGADQSHAWVSMYCGEEIGWLDLDPTNNKLGDTDHIPIAWGRDYNDVIPVRGVFLGGGNHTVRVTVDVQPIE